VVDWSVADVDLLSIRARGTYARTLKPLKDSSRSTWEGINYGIVIFALLGIIGATYMRRRHLQPMKLDSPKGKGAEV
jgi:ABC-2 type transport system permease protein